MATTRVFIDSRVNDIALLVSQFVPGTEFQVLDVDRDGIEQIVSALFGQSGYDSIQIISHGAPGAITIGSTVLDSATLNRYFAELLVIGNALTENGDLLLYGCNVGAGIEGQEFIDNLSHMTEADVAASNDLTGSVSMGGNWVLEASTGFIEATVVVGDYAQTNYSGVLSTAVSEVEPNNTLANATALSLTEDPAGSG
ncbi:MAG: DUF4347 domain-containing protein, partial [Chlorobium sp.]|nr:DUF4347 domain-containing protein [Chlorobium sp.]